MQKIVYCPKIKENIIIYSNDDGIVNSISCQNATSLSGGVQYHYPCFCTLSDTDQNSMMAGSTCILDYCDFA